MNFSSPINTAKLGIAAVLAIAVAGLVGCGGERNKDEFSNGVKVQEPAKATNTSADNYDDNVSGLITHNTLKKWIDNWDANKPKGITGKLVIFQQSAGTTGKELIKPNTAKNVFSYVENGWLETRDNGVMNIPSIVLSGSKIDNLVRKYGIDLENDLIVCAQGGGVTQKDGKDVFPTSDYMNQGRCWFTFSYWGVEQKNIAVLNGNNDYLFEQLDEKYFTSDVKASPIISRQVSSVKDLKVDNTSLYASIEDVINVLPLTDAPDNGDNVLLWDARSLPQYSGGQLKWEEKKLVETTADGKTGFQNASTRQSHPRGAFNLEFTNMLDVATGLYHDKATLKAIVKGGLSPKGEGFVSGNKLVQSGNGYQEGDTIIHYCETSMRAGVTIIPTAVILGIPSRLYDSAMIEWNSLTAGAKDKNGVEVLPLDSRWDTEALSGSVVLATGDVNPRSAAGYEADGKGDAADILENLSQAPLITNPYAEHANKVVEEDRAYKVPAVEEKPASGNGGSTGGASGALPSNPCGG